MKSKGPKQCSQNGLRSQGLNRVAKIGYGYLCLTLLKYSWRMCLNLQHQLLFIRTLYAIYDYMSIVCCLDVYLFYFNVNISARILEDTKGVIRNRKQKKDRQHDGQKKKDKRTNNDLQNITHKTKDRETGTPLKTGNELHMWEPVVLHI